MEEKLNKIDGKLDVIIDLLKNKDLPRPANAPNPLGRKRCISHKLIGGFRDPEIRDLIISMRKSGIDFDAIEKTIKKNYPDTPEKHVSRSAIHRFCESARKGRLREYGIDTNLNKMEG